jgi:hypothetical protein
VASWAWPHTPASNWARILLVGGPFDGEQAGFVRPDSGAPVQVVWSGWAPWGFDAWLYEWRGETSTDRGRTESLVFRPTGRRVGPEDIPPVIAEAVELWADGAALLQDVYDVPAELLWPGL